MGVLLYPLFGIGNTDRPQHLNGMRPGFVPAQALVMHDDFHHLFFDAQERIQRCHRVLEYHCDVFATDTVEFLGLHLQQINAPEQRFSGHAAVFGKQSHE